MLQRLADEVARLLHADAADCYLYDDGILRCAAVHGFDPSLVGFEFPRDTRARRPGDPRGAGARRCPTTRELELGVPHDAYEGFTDAVVAPMRWSDEVQGVLGVGRRDGAAVRRARHRGARGVRRPRGARAAQRGDVHAQRSRQARVQRGFYRIASVLGQSLSRTATLDAVAQAAAEALGGGVAAVLMPHARPARRSPARTSCRSRSRELLASGIADDGPLARAAAEGRVLASPALADDDRFAADALARRRGYKALLAVPVEARATTPAASSSSSSPRSASFTDDDLELARHLADATRGALERSELFEAERSARALAQQLTRRAACSTTELDPAAVLDEVVQQAPELVNADACAIRVLEDDELVVSAASGAAPTSASARAARRRLALRRRRAVARAGRARERRRRRAAASSSTRCSSGGNAAYLGVPLAGPEGRRSACSPSTRASRAPWREEEIEAMLALAASTSAALSNAELYQRVALEKERSFAILANIADGIVAVDREGKVVLWNAAAEQITGVPARGRARPHDRRGAAAHARVGQRHAGRATGSCRSRAAARRCWLSVTEAVMRDPAGAVAGRIFAFRDISADRLVEQMKSRLRLDRLARAAHAAHVDLRLRRDAAAPGRAVRRGGAAHVPRLHRVGVAAPDGDRRRAAERRAARHRRPAGRTSRRPTCATSSPRCVETAQEAAANGHEFVVDLPDEPLAAEADRDKLRQVFSILVDNAVKYSPDGGTVTVGAERKQRHSRGQRRRRGDRHPAGRPGADLPQVLPRRRRRDARRRGRDRARAVHRAGPRDGDGREDLGRVARRRRARPSRSSCRSRRRADGDARSGEGSSTMGDDS